MISSIFRKTMLPYAALTMVMPPPAMVAWPTVAQAQTAPTSRIITLTFTGTVTSDPSTTIEIRQADGSYTPYTGPLPTNAAYHAGDTVTITMNATVPTKAYYDSITAAGAPPLADGFYHWKLASGADGATGPFSLTPATISGGLSSQGYYGVPNYTTLAIVYDSKNDTYSLDGSGSFRDNGVLGAGFTYDPASATVSACSGYSCAPQQASSWGAFDLIGGADGSITSAFSYLWDSAGNVVGRFTLGLTGSWNLPTYNSGAATQVPEPGMLTLFGAGVIVPVLRRRRAIKARKG